MKRSHETRFTAGAIAAPAGAQEICALDGVPAGWYDVEVLVWTGSSTVLSQQVRLLDNGNHRGWLAYSLGGLAGAVVHRKLLLSGPKVSIGVAFADNGASSGPYSAGLALTPIDDPTEATQ